jgi:hypothetical protein
MTSDHSSDLSAGTTYYWRIDSVNSVDTTTGTVWRFTTALAHPRLVVAGTMGVLIWDDVDLILSDTPAHASLGSVTEGLSLALDRNRLYVASQGTNPLYIYDNAISLTDGATSNESLTQAAFGGTELFEIYDMFIDSMDRLWICDGGTIRLFLNASTLTSVSSSQAQFTHPFFQIYTMGVDIVGDKLIGGQISGAGAIVWDNPASMSGEGNISDWTLTENGGPRRMVISDDRLYVASIAAMDDWSYVNIWNNISSVSSTTIPNVTMGSSSNLNSAMDLMIRDDILVVTIADIGTSTKQVNIYIDASTITGDMTPDQEVSNAAMGYPKKAYLAADDRLYVMANGGISIFENATTSPSFVVKITTGITFANDFIVIE